MPMFNTEDPNRYYDPDVIWDDDDEEDFICDDDDESRDGGYDDGDDFV